MLYERRRDRKTGLRPLWTIQPLAVLEQVLEHGRAVVDPARLPYDPPAAHRWLTRQLQVRKPGWTGLLPWWCYTRRPDLRMHRFHQLDAQVRLELLVDPARVAEFPLWAWDIVFQGDLLTSTIFENQEAWRRARAEHPGVRRQDRGTWPPALRAAAETSWEALLDDALPDRVQFGPFAHSRERVAVIEEIREKDLREITQFHGIGRSL